MSLCGTKEEKEQLLKRLHRIEDQVKSICKMIEDDGKSDKIVDDLLDHLKKIS